MMILVVIVSGGRHFQVLCKMFSLSQIPKTVQLSTGKNSAKCNALNSYIECVNVFAVILVDHNGRVTNCNWAQWASVLRQTLTFQPLPSITSLESAKI